VVCEVCEVEGGSCQITKKSQEKNILGVSFLVHLFVLSFSSLLNELWKSGSDSVVFTHLNSLSGTNFTSAFDKKFPKLFFILSPVSAFHHSLSPGLSSITTEKSTRGQKQRKHSFEANVDLAYIFHLFPQVRSPGTVPVPCPGRPGDHK
jgi:hypothetical protein